MRNIICHHQKKFRYIPTIGIPNIISNQLEEIEYYSAYYLPIEEKANIQTALDTYGSVRLGKGNYSGVNVVLHNNQKLLGHPSLTAVSAVTFAQGTSNAKLYSVTVLSGYIDFEAGNPISNCIVKSTLNASLVSNGGKIENCSFINMISSGIRLNFSTNGYYRNNKFIKIPHVRLCT